MHDKLEWKTETFREIRAQTKLNRRIPKAKRFFTRKNNKCLENSSGLLPLEHDKSKAESFHLHESSYDNLEKTSA